MATAFERLLEEQRNPVAASGGGKLTAYEKLIKEQEEERKKREAEAAAAPPPPKEDIGFFEAAGTNIADAFSKAAAVAAPAGELLAANNPLDPAYGASALMGAISPEFRASEEQKQKLLKANVGAAAMQQALTPEAQRAADIQRQYAEQQDGSFLGDLKAGAAGSATSLLPLVGGIGAGLITKNPVAGVAATGALAAVPAAQQFSSALKQYKDLRPDSTDDEAIKYAMTQAGLEYVFEAIPPAKWAGFVKTILKTAAIEGGGEAATGALQDAVDYTVLPEAAPKSVEEFAYNRAVEGTLGALMGGGLRTLTAPVEAAAAKKNQPLPPTGDKDFDKGISVAAGLESQFSRRPKAGLQDVGEIFTQEAPKLNGPFNLTAKLEANKKLTPISEASQQLDLFEPATQGSLFGEPDVPAAEAEAKRAVAAAAGPQTAEIGKDTTAILEVPPQTTDEQAAIAAKNETVRQTENELAAADRLKNKRKLLSEKDIKATAKGVAESPLTEESIRRRLREKYPLAFSGENSPAAREEQRLAAIEYDATKAAIPKVAKEAIRDQRLEQLAKDEQFLEDRQRTFERDAELRYRKANQPAPEQTELGFTPGGQFDFLTNQKPTQVDVPTKTLLPTTETKFPSMDNGLPLSVANEGFTPSPAKTTTTTFAPQDVQAATGSVQKPKINLTNGVTIAAAKAGPEATTAPAPAADVKTLKESLAARRKAMEEEDSGPTKSPTPTINVSKGATLTAAKTTPVPASTSGKDSLYEEAVKLVRQRPKGSHISLSLIQRHFKIGFNRTQALVAELENSGVVSPAKADGSGRVAIDNEASPAVAGVDSKARGVKAKTEVIRRSIATSFNTGDKVLSLVKNVQKDLTDVDKRLVEVLSNNTSLRRTKVKVVSAEELLRIANKSMGRTLQESPLGLHDPATETIYLQDHSGDGATFKEGGITTEVILHELAHAATVAELNRPPTSPRTKQVRDAIEELEFLRGELKKQLEADTTLTAAQKHTVSEATLNSKELISYTYTYKPFRDLVASKTPSLWERLKNTIRVMIGLKPSEANIVDRILNLSDTIIKAQERGVTREAEYRAKYSGEASAAAAPKTKSAVTSGVFTEAEMAGDAEKNSLGIFKGTLLEWFATTGQNTAKSQEAIDFMKQSNERSLSEMEGSRIRLSAALDKSGYKLTPADATKEGLAKLKANPKTEAVAKEIAFMKRKINIMSLDIIEEYMKHKGETMTAQEVSVLNKIVNNLDEYVTRVYRTDIHSRTSGTTVSKHYVASVVQAYKDWKKAGSTNNRSPLAQTFINAKNFLIENAAGFRADWENKYTIEQLEDRYKLWKSKSFEAIETASLLPDLDFEKAHKYSTEEKKAALIEALRPIAAKSKEWFEQQAESMTYELLGVNSDGKPLLSGSVIQSFYKSPTAIDTTIITPRKDVPPAIRELWGEIKDPTATLYITAQKMSAMLAKEKYLNEEYERGVGKFLFTTENRPEGGNWEETIPNSQAFGALAGMRTSPRYLRTLRLTVEAGDINAEIAKSLDPQMAIPNMIYDLWNKGVQVGPIKVASLGSTLRWVKWASVVLKPWNYVTNALGSPFNLLLNGNWSPTAIIKSIKITKQLLKDAHNGTVTEDQLELWLSGQMDSALVGEYKAEIGRGIHDSILNEYAEDLGIKRGVQIRNLLVRPVQNTLQTSRERLTEVYAFMDLWVKFANYQKDKALLEGFYKRHNIPYTQESLIREAGERTKRTNLTYARAARFIKATEGSGLTAFGVYQWETYRAVIGNVMMAAADINRARKVGGDTAMVMDAMKRLAGTSAFLTGNTLGNKLYASLVAGVLGVGYGSVKAALGEGDDEEKEKHEKILKAMGSWGSGKIILPVGVDSKGNPLFVDISRFDPSDPVSIAMRQLQGGDMEAFKQTISGQWIVNPLVASVFRAVADSNPSPRMEKNSPHIYDFVNRAANHPLFDWIDQDTKDRVLKAVEGAAPAYYINDIPRLLLDSKDEATLTKALGAMGAGPMKFDVQKSATVLGATYGSLMSDVRDDLRSRLKVARVEDDRIEEAYVAQLTREAKQFDAIVTYYEGAVAAGFRPTQVETFLKDAGIPKEIIPDIRRGDFNSRLLQEKTLDTVLPTLERRSGDTRNAERELDRMNRLLDKLSYKYRNFNGKEES